MQTENVFERLISPVNAEDFFQDYFEKNFLHLQRNVSTYYHHILDTDDLDNYFRARNLTPDFLRVNKEGNDCDLDNWTKFEQRSNTDPYRIVIVEKLFSLFNEGATIIINAAQTAIPSISTFCSALEYELKTCVQPNIYITPPNSQGFVPHYDPHDVFIVQIYGNKMWLLYDYPEKLPSVARSVSEIKYETKEPDYLVEMNAGDLLYLPRGTVHFAKSSDTASIHITIGLIARYGFHLLKELVEIAQEDVFFRKMIPLALQSEQDKTNFAEEFKQNLTELIAKTDVKSLLERHQNIFIEKHLINKQGHFKDLLQVEQLTLNSIVSRRQGIDYLIEKNEIEVMLKFGEEKIYLPHFVHSSLDLLLQDNPFSVRDIKGLISDTGKLDLVKRFVKSGFLKIDSIKVE